MRVAPVVAGTVVDVPDERGIAAGQLDDALRDVEVLALLAADVVDLARPALAQDEVDGRRVILGVQPLAHLPAVAVDRQLETVEGVRDEERDDLLGILVRAVACSRRA